MANEPEESNRPTLTAAAEKSVSDNQSRLTAYLLALLALLSAPVAVAAGATEDAEGPGGGEVRQVAIGPKYKANGFHRWLWGTDYRALWTTPIGVEVLDLHAFAGGLKPLFRVGGRETKGLGMKAADGRDYTFRGIDKDPTSALPERLNQQPSDAAAS